MHYHVVHGISKKSKLRGMKSALSSNQPTCCSRNIQEVQAERYEICVELKPAGMLFTEYPTSPSEMHEVCVELKPAGVLFTEYPRSPS